MKILDLFGFRDWPIKLQLNHSIGPGKVTCLTHRKAAWKSHIGKYPNHKLRLLRKLKGVGPVRNIRPFPEPPV